MLESRIRYLHERPSVRGRGDLDIEFGTGKVPASEHMILRADGGQAAEISCVFGLFDTSGAACFRSPGRGSPS